MKAHQPKKDPIIKKVELGAKARISARKQADFQAQAGKVKKDNERKNEMSVKPAVAKPKVYIAGPMRGIKDFNRDAFNAAAKALDAKGWQPINPVDLERLWPVTDGGEAVDGIDLDGLMAIERKAAKNVDAIYLLKGWEKSEGAKRELGEFLLNGMGIHVLLEGSEIPDPTELKWRRYRDFVDGTDKAVARHGDGIW